MASALVEALRALGAAFAQLGLRWYVFGAQAALLHGAARLTADLDVTVDLGNESLAALAAALRERGFEPRVDDAAAFVERTCVLPAVHVASGLPVDVAIAGPGPEEAFFGRVQERSVEGFTVPVASPEDVVVMKILAGRPKDLEDAVAILAAQPTLDLDLVRRMLRGFEEALGRSNLLPELERAIERSRS